jgi:hypothetical protein
VQAGIDRHRPSSVPDPAFFNRRRRAAFLDTVDAAIHRRAAARCAAVNTTLCGTTSAIQTYAASQTYGITIASSTFTYTQRSCGYQVSASYVFSFTAGITGLSLSSR